MVALLRRHPDLPRGRRDAAHPEPDAHSVGQPNPEPNVEPDVEPDAEPRSATAHRAADHAAYGTAHAVGQPDQPPDAAADGLALAERHLGTAALPLAALVRRADQRGPAEHADPHVDAIRDAIIGPVRVALGWASSLRYGTVRVGYSRDHAPGRRGGRQR